MFKFHPFFAGCITSAAVVGGVALLCGAKASNHAHFDEITVGRINIVEPDGTKRLIISNRAQFPGSFEQGVEIARPDRANMAGMLFVNDEGTENGGLIQNGRMTADGKVRAGLALSFDRFRQDQALQLKHSDTETTSSSSLIINDVPAFTTTSNAEKSGFMAEADRLAPAERRAYWQRLGDEGRLGQPRIYLGTTRDRASALVLNDARGRPRLQLLVGANGDPQIQMLDDSGKVVRTVSAAD
ncbi:MULTISPECIES: hypothetical protein [Asticcacaulis]|uniref:hypothetical protein n=1 Tax=Asticcacaulis TaxID=76890 RepID=UPI001AE46D9B|nr:MULTISPECIES: hypothetical protein [Asticcacaulis]MBP2160348.1 hypothetical protein [Asticcacaulis solisilvae]MDR6801349.1 hypothetical protein [Asticcacaulis sp. BE141]